MYVRLHHLLGLTALAGLAGAFVALAGPLSPPAGPVAPTYKTLNDVEPRIAISAATTPGSATSMFVIAQPGSYYLTSDVTAPANLTAIHVTAANVTIDLNGFTIVGGNIGIYGQPSGDNTISVRNGTIRGAVSHGVYLGGFEAASVEDVRIVRCGGYGINASGFASVRRCAVSHCAAGGISVGGSAVLEGCHVAQNGGNGLWMSSGSRAIDCVAANNTGHGFSTDGVGCLLTSCTSSFNGANGFQLAGETLIEGCTATGNSDRGINAAYSCSVERCTASFNDHQGIVVGETCSVMGCKARENGGGQGYAGIWIMGSGTRAEGNESTNNGYGIFVQDTHNIIVKNTCRGNPTANFSVSAGNELAPIVTNPGSNNYTTATAWSNFAY